MDERVKSYLVVKNAQNLIRHPLYICTLNQFKKNFHNSNRPRTNIDNNIRDVLKNSKQYHSSMACYKSELETEGNNYKAQTRRRYSDLSQSNSIDLAGKLKPNLNKTSKN